MNAFKDKMPEELLELESKLMTVLKLSNPREAERKMFAVLGPEQYELIHLLVKNRSLIYYGSRYNQSQNQNERDNIIGEME